MNVHLFFRTRRTRFATPAVNNSLDRAPLWAGTMNFMARHAGDRPDDPVVVVTNPDDDVDADAFRAWLEHRQRGEPSEPGVRAADTLAEARVLGDA